jgi:hypothetical protein
MSDYQKPSNERSVSAEATSPLDAETRQRYEEARMELRRKLKPHVETIEDSERLSTSDFSIRINTQDY